MIVFAIIVALILLNFEPHGAQKKTLFKFEGLPQLTQTSTKCLSWLVHCLPNFQSVVTCLISLPWDCTSGKSCSFDRDFDN